MNADEKLRELSSALSNEHRLERELLLMRAKNERLRAALEELRQELWNDGDGGPRYSGYLAIIDAALEAEP